MLALVVFCAYRFGIPDSPASLHSAYQRAQAWVADHLTAPESSWRQVARKLNELWPEEGPPARFDLRGRVVRVADGDTISVLDANNTQHSIRFYGIDTPEYDQPHGRTATKALRELVANEVVGILVEDVDRLGRTVGTVYLGQTNVNMKMILDGHAWWYRHYAAADRELKSAEQVAKNKKLGLWLAASPIPPWDWRRGKRH